MDSINPIIRLGIHHHHHHHHHHLTNSRRCAAENPPPTSTLRPLTHLASHTTEQIKQDLQNLHRLYFPPEPVFFMLQSFRFRDGMFPGS